MTQEQQDFIVWVQSLERPPSTFEISQWYWSRSPYRDVKPVEMNVRVSDFDKKEDSHG